MHYFFRFGTYIKERRNKDPSIHIKMERICPILIHPRRYPICASGSRKNSEIKRAILYPIANVRARVHALLCFLKIDIQRIMVPRRIPSSNISRSGDGK